MGVLDNESVYIKYDPSGMNVSIKDLPNQINNSWELAKSISIPTHYFNAKNIVILGMGGSGIAGTLIKSYISQKIKIPAEVLKDYLLPGYVDSNSLVIAVSFSGGTEETINSFKEAANKGAKLIAITCGGEIESLAKKYNAPLYKINYSSSPRASLGHLFTPLLYILKKIKFIELDENEVYQTVEMLNDLQNKIGINSPTSQNEAKQFAEKIKGRMPIIIASGILAPVGIRFKCQINENSKSFASFEEMPETCHNFLQGLDLPDKIKDKIIVVFMQSKYDYPRNVIRFQAVQNILKKKGVLYQIINLETSGEELSEMMLYLHFTDYISLYLAMLEQTDPSPYDTITFLRNFLAENK